MKHSSLHLLAAALLTGCAMPNLAPPVSPAMSARAGRPAGILEQGRRLYTGRCATCHAIDPVGKYSASRWGEIVAEMADEAKLTPAEKDAVLTYILAARETPAPAS